MNLLKSANSFSVWMLGTGIPDEAFVPADGLLPNGTRNAEAMPLSLEAMSVMAE
jgi:hypothetical protein